MGIMNVFDTWQFSLHQSASVERKGHAQIVEFGIWRKAWYSSGVASITKFWDKCISKGNVSQVRWKQTPRSLRGQCGVLRGEMDEPGQVSAG
jgi:hypothetical protein